MSLEPFVTKLSGLADLSLSETDALLAVPFTTRKVPKYSDAIEKGDRPTYLYVVLEGWAARYSVRPDGTRRISGLMIPGDFCGIHALCNAPMDHAITALTKCTLARIELSDFDAITAMSRAIDKALWLAKLQDEAILRTWLLRSTDATRTLAHLICEVDTRLHPHDTSNERTFELPLTQEQIGDVVGITPVHTNRTIRALRQAQLASFERRTLTIPDVAALRREASFNADYLHLRT
jgi:CRP-like cAMP-binding protein